MPTREGSVTTSWCCLTTGRLRRLPSWRPTVGAWARSSRNGSRAAPAVSTAAALCRERVGGGGAARAQQLRALVLGETAGGGDTPAVLDASGHDPVLFALRQTV